MDETVERLPLPPRDFLILVALTDGVLHGYGLVKAVEQESRGEVRMDPANLYRALKRMQRDGLVEEAPAPAADPGAERRRYYRLTDSGREVAGAEAIRLSRLARSARVRKLIAASEATR